MTIPSVGGTELMAESKFDEGTDNQKFSVVSVRDLSGMLFQHPLSVHTYRAGPERDPRLRQDSDYKP
jgi:hypothetical protein